ncbi:MAG TPA: hypothetical protein VGJ60_07145 [Chloroflexota bacterium]|jgi:hypothetical protein
MSRPVYADTLPRPRNGRGYLRALHQAPSIEFWCTCCAYCRRWDGPRTIGGRRDAKALASRSIRRQLDRQLRAELASLPEGA